MNLDTAAAFMTPIMLYAARGLGATEAPFLYGAVLMANAASLYLPGSNLTNLLVEGGQISGAAFLADMWLPALTATAVTAIGLLIYATRDSGDSPLTRTAASQGTVPSLAAREKRDSPLIPAGENEGTVPSFSPGVGCVATVAAAGLVVVLREPALPVLALGVLAAVLTLDRKTAEEAVGPRTLAALLLLAVALGTLARAIDLTLTTGKAATAALGAGAAVAINNLPAATLLSAHRPAEPDVLLLGLNLGPNLAITGSLSALIWWRAAKRLGAQPSALTYSLIGAPLAIVAIALASLSLPG